MSWMQLQNRAEADWSDAIGILGSNMPQSWKLFAALRP
jgi:hypothetical protein